MTPPEYRTVALRVLCRLEVEGIDVQLLNTPQMFPGLHAVGVKLPDDPFAFPARRIFEAHVVETETPMWETSAELVTLEAAVHEILSAIRLRLDTLRTQGVRVG